ncbi:branched-chain amino acid aminotransferase [Desulfobaculum xiamenense]|uniref:Branched-chain amino acid aminotransferase n=1 Tax=Desulfobaculum xiamenense TaxID=995050 RepID=A0A846QJP0_9BACT|nr:aminotransferase class IV [Desulfobaculum xiamenense]NJB67317.1 branched-chain amino acid aminotransferase [Desulfobaculum xiamenense]
MIPVLDSEEYLKRMLSIRRPGTDDVLAFYEHRLGAICTDPKLMLMPWDDHLVHRGDGVFETLKYLGRRMYQVDAHLRRMKRSADAIHLTPPCSWERLREIVFEVAQAAGAQDGLVRILLGRGPGGFGIDMAECPIPSLYVVAYRFHPKPVEWYEKGASAFRTSYPAKQGWLATIKAVDYLPNTLMKYEATEKGHDYPICFDEHDFLAEGATENICIVDQAGEIVVPEFDRALAGTTLFRAIDLLAGEIPVRFRKIQENELYDAREILVLGTTGDCLSIVRYNGKPIQDVRPGAVSKRLRELILKDIAENGEAF